MKFAKLKIFTRQVKKILNGMEIVLLFLTTAAFTFSQYFYVNTLSLVKEVPSIITFILVTESYAQDYGEKIIQRQLKIHIALLQFSIRYEKQNQLFFIRKLSTILMTYLKYLIYMKVIFSKFCIAKMENTYICKHIFHRQKLNLKDSLIYKWLT